MKTLELKKDGQLWWLTVTRPEALNALNSDVFSDFETVLGEISRASYDELRVLAITGSGAKAFVAGADIKEISALSPAQAETFARRGQKVFQTLNDLKVPVIAVVNGFALGGGCELALACDFIFASENAKFGLPEVTLGLIPGFAGTVRLSRAVGLRRARELTFTADMLTAAEAFAAGLVNRVVPAAELAALVKTTAEKIMKRAPLAVAAAKLNINEAWDLDVRAAQAAEAGHFGKLSASFDMREGCAAFIEKRPPVFKGH